MPELDPNWEYYEPDPEIAEVMCDDVEHVSNYDRLMDDRLFKNGLQGIRYGRGDPNKLPALKEAKERTDNSVRLERKICPSCGYSFQPARGDRVYCSYKCKSRAQVGVTRRVLETKVCSICNREYTPSRDGQRVCSHSCASKCKLSLSKLALFKIMYEAGTRVTAIMEELDISNVTARRWRRRLKLIARGPRGVRVASHPIPVGVA